MLLLFLFFFFFQVYLYSMWRLCFARQAPLSRTMRNRRWARSDFPLLDWSSKAFPQTVTVLLSFYFLFIILFLVSPDLLFHWKYSMDMVFFCRYFPLFSTFTSFSLSFALSLFLVFSFSLSLYSLKVPPFHIYRFPYALPFAVLCEKSEWTKVFFISYRSIRSISLYYRMFSFQFSISVYIQKLDKFPFVICCPVSIVQGTNYGKKTTIPSDIAASAGKW